MSANDYTVADYIEANYFTSSSAAIEASADLLADFAFVAEGSVSQPAAGAGGNDYVEDGYIDNTYFTQDTIQGGGTQEGGATLQASFDLQASSITFKDAECLTTIQCDLAAPPELLRGFDAALVSLTASTIVGKTTKEINLVGFGNTELTVLGGIIVEGSVVQPGENSYVDGQYIDGNYFVAGVGVVPGITATMLAEVGKVVEATTNSGSGGNEYIDSNYIENGYFEGSAVVTTINVVFTLVGELTLDETGPQEGIAVLSSSFTSTQQGNKVLDNAASLDIISEMASVGFRIQEGGSDFEIISDTTSSAERTRYGEASFVETFGIAPNAGKITDTGSTMAVEFQQTTFGSRARGIDLYAFGEAAIALQVSKIAGYNIETSDVFSIGTDYIRQRSFDADANIEVFSFPSGERIRDNEVTTTGAFSFECFAGAIRDPLAGGLESAWVVANNERLRDNDSSITMSFIDDFSVNRITENNVISQSDFAQSTDANYIADGVADLSSYSEIFCIISAIRGCDMVAFSDGEMISINQRFRDYECVMSNEIVFDVVPKVTKDFESINQSDFDIQETYTRIRPYIGNRLENDFVVWILPTKIKQLSGSVECEFSSQPVGNVRVYFVETEFSVTIADEEMADTFFSRYRGFEAAL